MNTDICNAPVSLTTDAALQSWNKMVLAYLAHGTATPRHLGDVLATAPDFAMGHAARGLFSLLMGRAEMWQVAEDARAAARAACQLSPPGVRERGWVQALDQWLAESPTGAIAALETVLDRCPQDTLSAKAVQAIRFILGDAKGMRASVERVLPAHGADHPLRGYLMGCHAFTLEETGDYGAAERTGRAGLVHAPDDAWGLHAVTHVPADAGTISFIITGDEEGPALHGTRALIDYMREVGEQPDLCLVGEPTSVNRLGDMMKIGRRGSVNILSLIHI